MYTSIIQLIRFSLAVRHSKAGKKSFKTPYCKRKLNRRDRRKTNKSMTCSIFVYENQKIRQHLYVKLGDQILSTVYPIQWQSWYCAELRSRLSGFDPSPWQDFLEYKNELQLEWHRTKCGALYSGVYYISNLHANLNRPVK